MAYEFVSPLKVPVALYEERSSHNSSYEISIGEPLPGVVRPFGLTSGLGIFQTVLKDNSRETIRYGIQAGPMTYYDLDGNGTIEAMRRLSPQGVVESRILLNGQFMLVKNPVRDDDFRGQYARGMKAERFQYREGKWVLAGTGKQAPPPVVPREPLLPNVKKGRVDSNAPGSNPVSGTTQLPAWRLVPGAWTAEVPVTVLADGVANKRAYVLQSLHKHTFHFTETANPLRVTCSAGGPDELIVEFNKDKQPVAYAFEINGHRYYDLDGDGMFDYVAHAKTRMARVLIDFRYVDVVYDQEAPTTRLVKTQDGKTLLFAKGKWSPR